MRICEQVADGLVVLGQSVSVLTSTYRNGPDIKPYPVHRLLSLDPDWNLNQPIAWRFYIGRKARETLDIENLSRLVDTFQPDVIFVWHAHGLSRRLLQVAENLPGIKTVYYFANYLPELPDEYIQYWQSNELPNGVKRTIKTALSKLALHMLTKEGKPIPLKYEHSISVSNYVQQRLLNNWLIGSDAVVIPNGVDLDIFYQPARRWSKDRSTVNFLVAGRVAPEKGIHTLLKAFRLLQEQSQLCDIHLTILGDGPPEYREGLTQIVIEANLQEYVQFEPPVPTSKMISILAQNDVLILPSEWDEPLACIMLEAMASGLLVIGTDTGGSGEVLLHEKTGLVFRAGNSESVAKQIKRVLDNRGLGETLAVAGQQEVVGNFDMKKTIQRIEQHLRTLLELK